MEPVSDRVQDEINKRLTLNMLVQGAAVHSHFTLHYLVQDDLNAISPKLIPLYDKVSIGGFLANWYGDLVLVAGRPKRFWSRVQRPDHPFHAHALLVKHGPELAETARVSGVERCRAKKVSTTPVFQTVQLLGVIIEVLRRERRHKEWLQELARQATSQMWGIDEDRLDAALTTDPRFGDVRKQPTFAGKLYGAAAVGWGGVVRSGSQLQVMARAWVWPLLTHELVKGTAELVCLHGLNTLDPETYEKVMEATERIDFEPWHMQAGSELWRRFLAVSPTARPLSETLMHVARLDPQPLEALMMAVVENPDVARRSIARL